MAVDTNLSILASAMLALAWTTGPVRGSAALAAEKEFPGPPVGRIPDWAWTFLMSMHKFKQVLPIVFACCAATSFSSMLCAGCSLGFAALEDGAPGWLGDVELSLIRRWALLAALAVWRAVKLEELLQRMQRSVGVVKVTGFAPAFHNAIHDPVGWIWSPVWGISRRLALVVLTSLGCGPFVSVALPAVALDEFLSWALAQLQHLMGKTGYDAPAVVTLIVFPIIDMAHFIPAISRVLLLGIFDYPEYNTTWNCQVLLVASALASTVHSCHAVYSTVCVEIPDMARQLYASF